MRAARIAMFALSIGVVITLVAVAGCDQGGYAYREYETPYDDFSGDAYDYDRDGYDYYRYYYDRGGHRRYYYSDRDVPRHRYDGHGEQRGTWAGGHGWGGEHREGPSRGHR